MRRDRLKFAVLGIRVSGVVSVLGMYRRSRDSGRVVGTPALICIRVATGNILALMSIIRIVQWVRKKLVWLVRREVSQRTRNYCHLRNVGGIARIIVSMSEIGYVI